MLIDSVLRKETLSLLASELPVPQGARVVYFFEEPAARYRFVPFIASGLLMHDRCIILTDQRFADVFRSELAIQGVDSEPYEKEGQLLIITGDGASVLSGGANSFRSTRCLCDVSWMAARGWNMHELLRFEVEGHLLVEHQPCTTICQYDGTELSDDQIRAITAAHQYTINGSRLLNNENCRSLSHILFHEMDAQLRVLAELQDLSLKLTSALSLSDTLDAVIGAAMSICRAERAAVSCFNESGELRIMRSRGLTDGYLRRRRLRRDDPIIAALITSRRPAILDVDRLEGVSPNYEAWRYEGVRSIVAMPLVSEGEMFGVIGTGATAARSYTRIESDAMAILAAQAGAAITTSRLLEQLRGANRAKDEFLATLSHELRTPLTPILGWINILKRSADSEPLTCQGLETIERNAKQQAELINDLLDMTRIISGKIDLVRETTDLASLIRSAANQISPQAEARAVAIDLRLPDSTLLCEVDPVRLQQIMANLLTNAVKFTPDGGTVAILVDRKEGRSDEGDSIVIEVADTGIGIEPEFINQVFERFTQAHGGINRRYGGLGLGLAITRALVEMHGGEIRAASEGLGKGSRFTVRLPVRHSRAEARLPSEPGLAGSSDAALQSSQAAQSIFGSVFLREAFTGERLDLNVLIVEDSTDTLDMLKLWLRSFGCEVRTAGSAVEGLDLAARYKPDLVISDIGMPDVDGYELIRKLRRMSGLERVPAIALTGYARDEDRELALEAGYNVHVAKPADMNRLVKIVKELTGQLSELSN
jgi:signal transduction histidine kinase/ActR/RegA family two-component response regulator